MDDNHQYVFDLEYDEIYVNQKTLISEKNITESKLNFQLLNPSRYQKIEFVNPNKYSSQDILTKLQNKETVDDVSYLHFFFYVGDGKQDLISINDAKKITVQTENEKWSSSDGTITSGTLSYIVSCEDTSVIETLLSLRIIFENIYSFAPIGQTSFYVEIQNVVGIDSLIKVFPIQKKQSTPKVLQFTSNYTTFKVGQKATLKWLLTNEKYAQLQPGNINIKEEAQANTYTVDVTRNVEYQLTVFNGYDHDTANLNLYIVPPQINSFSFEEKQQTKSVSWDTNYATSITLYTTTEETISDDKGSKVISLPDSNQVVLRVTGYEYTEYYYMQVAGLIQKNNSRFELRTKQFKSYSWTKWNWDLSQIVEGDEVSLIITEFVEALSTEYTIQVDRSGGFEYISVNPIAKSKLICSSSGKVLAEYNITALKEGV